MVVLEVNKKKRKQQPQNHIMIKKEHATCYKEETSTEGDPSSTKKNENL